MVRDRLCVRRSDDVGSGVPVCRLNNQGVDAMTDPVTAADIEHMERHIKHWDEQGYPAAKESAARYRRILAALSAPPARPQPAGEAK